MPAWAGRIKLVNHIREIKMTTNEIHHPLPVVGRKLAGKCQLKGIPVRTKNLRFVIMMFACGLVTLASAQNSNDLSATDRLVCDHVRVLPRAGFPQAVKGAIIQGSNTGPTADFVDLATITTDTEDGKWVEVKFTNNKVYRFLRYFAPKDSWCNVAELEFYHGDTKLRGSAFGTYGSRDNGKNTYDKVFDGDPKTFFEAFEANDQYVGIELFELPSTTPAVVTSGGSRKDGAHFHFHIGNSLTDTEGEYMQAIAKAAGFSDDGFGRNSIPGSPIHFHWSLAIRREKGGFGTPYGIAAEKFAPVNDLCLQVFVQNGDSSNPTPLVGFYDLFKEHSPGVRLWVYGQWAQQTRPDSWEDEVLALHRVYVQAAINAQQMRPLNPPVAVIPAGFALINLKHAVERGDLPGIEKTTFFATTFDDGIHLSDMGRYYIGLVHYACIYDKNPVGVPAVALGKDKHLLSPELTKALEQIAWDSVQVWRAAPEKIVAYAVPGEFSGNDNVGSIPPHGAHTVKQIWGHGGEGSYFITPAAAGQFILKVNGVISSTTTLIGAAVFLNDVAVGTIEFPEAHGKQGSLIESKPLPLNLKAGLNTLRIVQPKNDGFTLDTLRITNPDGSGIKHTLPFCDAFIMGMDVEPGATAVKSFKVSDAETPAGQIKVTAAPENLKALPADAVAIEVGDDGIRKLSIKHPGQAGETRLVVTITNNAGLRRQFCFNVKCK